MRNVPLTNETNQIRPPDNWDPAIHGDCLTISAHVEESPIYGRIFTTVWDFSDEERKLIAEGGGKLQLSFHLPRHPVMNIGVLDPKKGTLTPLEA